MPLLATAAYLLPGPTTDADAGLPLADAAVYVEGDEIQAVGAAAELRARFPHARELGGSDYVLVPGLVDGHQHGRGLSYVQRGVVDQRLELWLHDLRDGVPLDPYLGVLWAALRLLAAGVTTAIHSHVTTRPEAYEQELRDTVRAYQDSGLRATVALDIRDRAFFTYQDDAEFLESLPPELRQRALAAFPVRRTPDVDAVVGLLPELRRHADPARVRFALGPQAPQWCTMETLQRARAAARELGCGLHLHCAETEAQLAYFLHAHRKTPVRFLHDLGLLGSDVSLAHCVWLSPEDIQLLAASGTIVVHNPSSNLRLRSGIAPVAELLRAGVAVALGTDSLTLDESHDLFHEMRLAARLQALPGRGGATIGPHRWLAAATVAGARAALRPERLGSIRAGYKADLVLLDRRALEEPFTANLPERLADVVFFRARGAHVRAVIVGGQVVIENGRFVHVDPQTLAEQIAEHAATFRPDPARRELLALLKRRVQAYLEHLAPAYAD